jgi:hypothetical protein
VDREQEQEKATIFQTEGYESPRELDLDSAETGFSLQRVRAVPTRQPKRSFPPTTRAKSFTAPTMLKKEIKETQTFEGRES